MPLEHDNFVPVLLQLIGRGDSDHAASEHHDAHCHSGSNFSGINACRDAARQPAAIAAPQAMM
jgi:hypothetical protein